MEEEDDENFPAVGFRFYPTEEELVSFYLPNKLNGTRPEIDTLIPVLDVYDYNPSQLPQLAGEHCPADGEEWFFFIPRQDREARGGRPNRLTAEGYWKATGSPGDVYSCQNNRVIGRKRTMVFYVGRAPNGRKTSWKMNEYKAIAIDHDQPSSSSSTSATPQLREELSLCRIYKSSKCLRAFDRRPPSEAVRGNPAAAAHHHHRRDTIFNNQLNDPVLAQETTDNWWSLDSTSSGDDQSNFNYQSQSVDSVNNPDLGMDNEPLWDWDRFNLF